MCPCQKGLMPYCHAIMHAWCKIKLQLLQRICEEIKYSMIMLLHFHKFFCPFLLKTVFCFPEITHRCDLLREIFPRILIKKDCSYWTWREIQNYVCIWNRNINHLTILKQVCCEKRPKIVPDQIMVRGTRVFWRFWILHHHGNNLDSFRICL